MSSHEYWWLYEKYMHEALPDWDIVYLYYDAKDDIFCLGNVKRDVPDTVVGKFKYIGEF